MDIIPWVRKYHSYGFQIIPISGKRPALEEWKMLQTHKQTEQEVLKLFEIHNGCTGLGVICGKLSNLTVVDIDVRGDVPVDKLRDSFPRTLTSMTGSGGYHLFYRYEPALKNSTGLIHPQVDIKTEGGYVVLPPSVHPKTQNKYQFVDLNETKTIEPFPRHVTELERLWHSDKLNVNKERFARIAKGMPDGHRNRNMARVIGKLINVFSKYDQNNVDIVYEIAEYINQRNDPPMAKREFDRTFLSICERHYNTINNPNGKGEPAH